MYEGTLATRGPWEALVTFQQLIILADKHGTVDMTPEVISRVTTVPLEVIQTGLKALQEPDPHSRSSDEGGRRIVPIDADREWGWRIVNYCHYRKIRSEEERREYHRNYMRKRRAVNPNVKVSTDGEQSQPIAVSSKQYAVSNKKQTPLASSDESLSAVIFLPLADKSEFPVLSSFRDELDRLYPAVDPDQTLREIRAWCISNPTRCKTRRGVKSFINRWFAKQQDQHGRS